MELDTMKRYRVFGLVVATLAMGAVVAVGVVAFMPQKRSKRLVKRIDRNMHKLEEQLGMAPA